jgi:hypothetical protein
MISMSLSRLLRDLCPSYAASSREFGRRIPYMSTSELLEAEAILAELERLTDEGARDALLAMVAREGVDHFEFDRTRAESTQLESALMTGEVDRWIAEHPGSGVTRAEVEEYLAFLRDALVPAMRQSKRY